MTIRLLGTYKKYVRNKAKPEGSIAEAYISYEALTYCSMYLTDAETTLNRPERHCDGTGPNGNISVFSHKVRPMGKGVMVEFSKEQLEIATWYIFNNCEEIETYLKYVLSLTVFLNIV